MKSRIHSVTRHFLLLCGIAGFMTVTACQREEQPMDPPEAEEVEDESTDVPATPPPAPGTPITPAE